MDIQPPGAGGLTRTIQLNPPVEIPPTGLLVATPTDLQGRNIEVAPPVLVPEPQVALGLVVGALRLSSVGRVRRGRTG